MESSELEKRLDYIERRLAKIETVFRITPPPREGEAAPAAPPPAASPVQAAVPPRTEPTAPHPGSMAGEEIRPGNWLGLLAIVCFVFAAGFIVKLSIESGWLTHTRQIGLASLFGLSLVAAGFVLRASDREYASLLPAAGVIVLYLTAFAAHRLYALIPFEAALGAVALISALCVWLYLQLQSDIYALTAAVGSYIVPLFLGLNASAVFTLYYFLLCSVAFAAISIWIESRLLILISAYLAILMSALVGRDLDSDVLVAVMLGLHFGVFAAGTYGYSMRYREPLSHTEAWAFLPVLLIFYAAEYYFLDRIHPDLAPWMSLAFAGVLIGLYLSAKRVFPDSLDSQGVILAFATIVCFHSFYLEILPSEVRPWLFVAIMTAAALRPPSVLAIEWPASVYAVPMLALGAVLVIEYLSMLFHLFDDSDASWLVVSLAAFASMWFAIVHTNRAISYGNVLLVAAHLMAVLALYRLGYDAGSLTVSALWLVYAVAVMGFAFARKDAVMAKSALIVLAFAAGKALLYDASSAPTVVRIICLLLTGAVLYGCGLFMRRIDTWDKTPKAFPAGKAVSD